jgi:sensor c-di-GMP phosphodiesterase-like protein
MPFQPSVRNRLRTRTLYVLAVAAALLVAAVAPWLAWREAERQAYEIESSIVLDYAHDVLHRADETASQADVALRRLETSGLPPCSAPSVAIMREIDLTSSYIQAVGHVNGTAVDCSSLGSDPVDLGRSTFLTSKGVTMYEKVRVGSGRPAHVLGIRRGDFVAFVHDDLPLDTWTPTSDVALGVLHVEDHAFGIMRGTIDVAWLARLAGRNRVTFVDDGRLVAIVRSANYLTAAVVAAPIGYLHRRVVALSWRVVPAALLGGLAGAAAILLLLRRELSMETALRKALRRNELFLLYQPLIDLDSGTCIGVEALLRWRPPTGELIGPDLFIPVAERTGLITDVTARVFQLVARDAGNHLAQHPDFHVGVNLSPADLRTDAIVELVDTLLARTGARPSNLIVEITERGFLDLDAARSVLSALRERGVEVAIDDFGTGYSNLSYLETLDLDFLKIDRSFIEAIGTGAPTSQVIGHIMAMAHALNLRMIAEGVESEAQAEFLRTHGVHNVQGWLFGKPMPFADVVRTLAQAAAHPAPA